MKYIVLGGHLTPAIAFMQYAKSKGDDVLFLGRELTSSSTKVTSREQEEVEQLGFTFRALSVVKFDRYRKLQSLIKSPLIIKTVLEVRKQIDGFKPDVIVSFGGYISIPVALAAIVEGVPVVLHEQTTRAGLANRIVAPFAKLIAISFPSSSKYFPAHKTHLTGNLLRHELYEGSEKPQSLSQVSEPFIYVTGGNQGSQFINSRIQEMTFELTKKYFVVHQTGASGLQTIQKTPVSYLAKSWFSATEVSWLLSHARIVIGRSGANTVSEIFLKGVPSILIPLPGTQQNEQVNNARVLEEKGASIVLLQQGATKEAVEQAIERIEATHKTFFDNAQQLKKEFPARPIEEFYQLIHQSIVG